MEFTITTDKAYAQSFFYNILTAIVASVVDKDEAMAHEVNGDFGYEWLKTNSAGSGPMKLRSWKPNDSIILEAADDYWGGEVALEARLRPPRPEGASRRLLVENGDADMARRLPPNDAQAIAANADLKIFESSAAAFITSAPTRSTRRSASRRSSGAEGTSSTMKAW
jgi:peptide/nickel transport system substrate-binding protein